MMDADLKMYDELAEWWQLVSPLIEYAEEAEFFLKVFAEAGVRPGGTLLELGSGGGSNAYYFKPHFATMTLTDLSPQMLDVSRIVNPEAEHIQGNMRTLRLGRVFDVVFIHDAIDYMTTTQALREAMETAFVHCKPGGLALFVPDHVRETFEPTTDSGGSDGEGRSLRYLEWAYDPDAQDTEYIVEYAYLLREGNQPTRVAHDLHHNGLFSRAEWLDLLQQVGFKTHIVRDPFERDLFVAHKRLKDT